MKRPHFVYFIKPIGMDGPIKIGCSVSPDQRRETLRNWSPFPLEVVAEIAGDRYLERRFHARFRHLFISHEWFRPALELAASIELIKLGTFDVETLPAPTVLHNTPTGERKPWTAEQRLAASYTHRCNRMGDRSGFRLGGRWNPMTPEGRAAMDAYLAAPHIHGEPCNWRKKEQKAWLAKVAPESAAA